MTEPGEQDVGDEPRDHLLVWKRAEPIGTDAAMEALTPLERADALIGSAEGVAADWAGARVGCVVVKGEPAIAEGVFDDWDAIPFPGGVALTDDRLVWVEEPPQLPAAPLVVTKGRDWSFAPTVRVELDIESPSEGQLALLDELTELFLEAYRGEGAGALEGAELAEPEDGGRTLTLVGWVPPDSAAARAHLHWWLEEVARFLPLRAVRIETRTRRGSARGLPPSWIGPLIVIGAAFGTRFLDPSIALRANALVWIFGPLMITFLSRFHVGRVTWLVTVGNALLQGGLALVMERPDFVLGAPPDGDVEALVGWAESVRTVLEYLLYASGGLGLVWVLTYLANRRSAL